MKKPIKDYENYLIYDDGSVFNTNTNKMLSGSIGEHGYKYYRLSKNGNKKMFYAHRLVAEAFLDNPNNLPAVNHIDGNKLNNEIYNLEWISYSENAQHFHEIIKDKKTNRKIEKYVADLPGEEWISAFNNCNYMVSNLGRVRNIKTNNILHPVETCGYYKVRLSLDGKTTDWLIHKLVFLSFNKTIINDNYCIDHIDGNKHNNALNNLRYITISDNVKNAYYIQKTNSNIKPVSQFNKDGKLISTFPSSREAGRQLNLDSSSIIKCCKGKLKTIGGFIFRYA